jgi:hypothetical protein
MSENPTIQVLHRLTFSLDVTWDPYYTLKSCRVLFAPRIEVKFRFGGLKLDSYLKQDNCLLWRILTLIQLLWNEFTSESLRLSILIFLQ